MSDGQNIEEAHNTILVDNNRNDNREELEQDHDIFEDLDHNSWTATGDMANLPTDIFKKHLLPSSTRKLILQAEPKNKQISFTPPDMDRRMQGWQIIRSFAILSNDLGHFDLKCIIKLRSFEVI